MVSINTNNTFSKLKAVYKFIVCTAIIGLSSSLHSNVFASSIPCTSDKLACIDSVKTPEKIELRLHTSNEMPITVVFNVKTTMGHSSPLSQHLKISRSISNKKVLELRFPNKGRWRYDLTVQYHIGVKTAQHNNDYVYRLPFQTGQKIKVAQGYYDRSSHFGAQKYALDFAVPEGTPVLAARDGVVVATKSNSAIGGSDENYGGFENYVWVEHDDGTIGQYVHLKKDGVIVQKGQIVRVGDTLGFSGCTGVCEEPHLHFQVSTPLQKEDDINYEGFKTFPTKFHVGNLSRPVIQGEEFDTPSWPAASVTPVAVVGTKALR